MHFSIAPVELTTQMNRQFSNPPGTASSPKRSSGARPGVRHRVSVMLHHVANVLEPAQATPGR